MADSGRSPGVRVWGMRQGIAVTVDAADHVRLEAILAEGKEPGSNLTLSHAQL